MNMTHRLTRIVAWIATSLLLPSLQSACSDKESGDVCYATLYDVVEYAGHDAIGNTVFTLYAPDAETPATLKASSQVDTGDLEAGECMLLGYVPLNGKSYTSGTVDVKAVGVVTNDRLMKGKPETLTDWDSDPVWLASLWRAGGKVVMRMQLVYDNKPRIFRLVVDETTINDEYPDAYLVNIRRNDSENFMRQYYVAFDVHALWTYATCKGLRIHVNNSNDTSLREFLIEKPSSYASGGEEEIPDGSVPDDPDGETNE